MQSQTNLTQAEQAYKGMTKKQNEAPQNLTLKLQVSMECALQLLQIIFNFAYNE